VIFSIFHPPCNFHALAIFIFGFRNLLGGLIFFSRIFIFIFWSAYFFTSPLGDNVAAGYCALKSVNRNSITFCTHWLLLLMLLLCVLRLRRFLCSCLFLILCRRLFLADYCRLSRCHCQLTTVTTWRVAFLWLQLLFISCLVMRLLVRLHLPSRSPFYPCFFTLSLHWEKH